MLTENPSPVFSHHLGPVTIWRFSIW